MMRFALTNGRILMDGALREDAAVLVRDGRVEAIAAQADVPRDAAVQDLGGHMLLPGFIDTQVNGGGGVLLNDVPTAEGIAAIGRAHRQFGTTGFMPTLISDDLDTVEQALDAVDAAIEAGVPGVLGIHIEGPFLNVKRKGIHDPAKIRDMDEEALSLLSRPGRGRRMITVAPEKVAPAMLDHLVEAGVIVCAGHTDATYETARDAFGRGVRGVTHLFNTMTPLGSREPGVVGAALEHQDSWCGIIVDGVHVSPATLRLALRCKPADRFMLVTDAMPSVGAAMNGFELNGKRISVRDGVCIDSNGTLAGSDLDMASAVRNAVHMLGLDLPTAVAMASHSPADFLGLGGELGRIAPGYRASFVLADDDLVIRNSWIDGETVAGRSELQPA